MELKDLHRWRFWMPGMLALGVCIILLLFDARGTFAATLTPSQFSLVIPLILSVFYSVFGMRHRFYPDLFRRVDDEIERRVFELRPDHIQETDFDLYHANNVLLNIFWTQVDAEKSLEKKSLGIMQNGLIVTSLADSVAIFSMGAVFGVAYVYWKSAHSASFRIETLGGSVIFATLALLSQFVLLPRSIQTHLDLSNEQLNYIAQYCRSSVTEHISELYGKLRQTSTPNQ